MFPLNDGESIFKHYMDKRNTLVKNKRILQSSYIPEQLPHRETQIKEIVEIVAPSLAKDKPSNILIIGKTGTGKTAVVKYIGKELKKADENEENCSFIYINCEVVDTPYGILYNIGNQIIKDETKSIPFTGWSLDRVFSELTKYVDKENKIYIIVLDEIDRSFQKNGDDIFYFLTTINEVLEQSKVSIIGISNNPKFTEFLDPKIKSRLGEEKIIFPPYNTLQLEDILKDRSKDAFEPGVLSEGVVSYCAALAAQDMGDARRALDLLRIASDIAERNNDNIITEAHVKYAKNKIELDAVSEVVRTLTPQSKTVLMSIVINTENDNPIMNTGDVFTTYKYISEIIESSILTQRRVAGLISELDMMGIIHARVKSFGRAGRTREIELGSKEIIDLIKSDVLFKKLKNYKNVKQTTLI
ncbi:MAG: archaeal cell division control protein 6 [Candidatus Methanomethylophilaceae archaeon]|nr:archaeal cell division control protein 6 [Candidatus Methanomethylophilaceae archaeon]